MFLCHGRAGIVDLSTGESSEQELSEEVLMKGSSVSVADVLRKEHGDPIVFGTGLLTGSLVPAACAGLVATSKGVMPLLGSAGVELKLAGFDFIVVKGESKSPVYLWIRDGIAEVVPAPEMSSMDSWTRTEKIRTDQGDRRIQVVAAGPWGDAMRPSSCLSVNHWLGEDDVFTGAEFGRRKLAAVAFRGMGELEVSDPEAHLKASLTVRSEHSGRLGQSSGLASFWDGAKGDDFSSLLHRTVSCFGCPYQCRSYLKVNEDPRQMALVEKEPGYLHFDIPSLEAAKASGMSIRDATLAFMECARSGADPSSIISSGAKDIEGVRKALSSGQAAPADRPSAPGSFRACTTFDECVALGLCPRYWAKVGIDMDAVTRCAEPALGRAIG